MLVSLRDCRRKWYHYRLPMANCLDTVWKGALEVVAYDFRFDYSFTLFLPHRIVLVEPIFQVECFFGSHADPFDCELVKIARLKQLSDGIA